MEFISLPDWLIVSLHYIVTIIDDFLTFWDIKQSLHPVIAMEWELVPFHFTGMI